MTFGYFVCKEKGKAVSEWDIRGRGEEHFGVPVVPVVCSRFAIRAWGDQKMKKQGWSNSFFGWSDEPVVLVAERLKRGPTQSRVGAFPQVFSMADSRSNSTQGRRSKPRIGLWVARG